MKNITKKEIFSIPNLLGYFRLLLIPIFSYIYCTADSLSDYYTAAIIAGISGITDMLDGKIARRFNMITELGKFLDPVADKLTQAALILCLSTRYSMMWLLIGIFIVKEGFMLIAGAILLYKKHKKLDGAQYFGKFCTAFLDVIMFVLLLLPNLSLNIVNALIVLCASVMIGAFVLYIPVFYQMGTDKKK